MLILVGIVAGILSGLLGVGGGTIIVPAVVILLGTSQQLAQGISLAVIIPTAAIGAYGYYRRENANIKTAALLACGAIAGAFIGSEVACSISSRDLKIVFGVFAFIVAGKIIKDVLSDKK